MGCKRGSRCNIHGVSLLYKSSSKIMPEDIFHISCYKKKKKKKERNGGGRGLLLLETHSAVMK